MVPAAFGHFGMTRAPGFRSETCALRSLCVNSVWLSSFTFTSPFSVLTVSTLFGDFGYRPPNMLEAAVRERWLSARPSPARP